MLFPNNGSPTGSVRLVDRHGIVVGMDVNKINFGVVPEGVLIQDSRGKIVPVRAYKVAKDGTGMLVMDSLGRYVPISFNCAAAGATAPVVVIGSPCNSTENFAGGNTPFTKIFNMGSQIGKVTVSYNMFIVPDSLDVYYDGVLVGSTGGPVSGTGSFTFIYNPTTPGLYSVTVVVTPNPIVTSTQWNFTISCPVSTISSFSGGGGADYFRQFEYNSGVWTTLFTNTTFASNNLGVEVYNQFTIPAPVADGRVRRAVRSWAGSASANIVGKPLYLQFTVSGTAYFGGATTDIVEGFIKTPKDNPATFDLIGGTSIGLFTPAVADVSYLYLITPSYVSGTTYMVHFMIQNDIAKRAFTGGSPNPNVNLNGNIPICQLVSL